MIRTQISLTEQQMADAKTAAGRQDVSLAELLRRALDRYLAEDDHAAVLHRARTGVGGFRSGRSDVAREHDATLAELDRW